MKLITLEVSWLM